VEVPALRPQPNAFEAAAVQPAPRPAVRGAGSNRVALILAVVLLGIAVYWTVANHRKIADWPRARGEVVALRVARRIGYCPTVVFTAASGMRYRFEGGSGFYRIGETVEVVYPAEAPNEAMVNSMSDLMGGPLICALFAGLCFLAWSVSGRGATPAQEGRCASWA
jgi:hypothetical protein